MLTNTELLFPFPGMEKDKSVRLGFFVDAGMVGETYNSTDLRYSTGLSALWVSPFGPLKISIAKPFKKDPLDSTQPLQFTFGGAF